MAEGERERGLRAAVEAMGGVVFAARGEELDVPMLTGWRAGKDGPDAVDVHHRSVVGLGGGELEVETSTVLWTGKPMILVRQLLGSDRPDPRAFPYASTVTKGSMTIRIAGRRRTVDLYRCGERWIIACRSAGRFVTVTGRTIDPAGIELVRLDLPAAEAALARSQAERRAFQERMRAASQPR